MAVLEPYKGDYYLWKFLPSQPASIIFTLLFLAITFPHFWRIYQMRSWFCVSFAIGCLCEVIGYVARAVAYNNTNNLSIYVIQSAFLVIAPAFFAASIYMTLSRIIRCVKGEHLSIIRINWLSKIFVVGDLLSLNVQSGAAGLTPHENLAKIGENIILGGLVFQLALLALFFAIAVTFEVRLRKKPTRESYITDAPWKQTLYMTYTVSILIFARSVFRIVEYAQGIDGYSLTHEWTLYVFDGVPMLGVAVFFVIWYPGYIKSTVTNSERIELSNRGYLS
ncbi:putative RTA1 domain protein [Bisporella sp. PMI_857]|nr:putative RTA1 domain protein [Bisporella sp. PMI_857]